MISRPDPGGVHGRGTGTPSPHDPSKVTVVYSKPYRPSSTGFRRRYFADVTVNCFFSAFLSLLSSSFRRLAHKIRFQIESLVW